MTPRGNRRQQTFFHDEDYVAYLALPGPWCSRRGMAVWAYCLMPNHVHLIVVPEREDGRWGSRHFRAVSIASSDEASARPNPDASRSGRRDTYAVPGLPPVRQKMSQGV